MFLSDVQSRYRYQNEILISSGENRHHSKGDWKPDRRIKEKNHEKASLNSDTCPREDCWQNSVCKEMSFRWRTEVQMGGEQSLKTNIVTVKHICKLKSSWGISGMRFL